jgi:hypothetical protein
LLSMLILASAWWALLPQRLFAFANFLGRHSIGWGSGRPTLFGYSLPRPSALFRVRCAGSGGSEKRKRGRSPLQKDLVCGEDRLREFEYEAKGAWSKFDKDTIAILLSAYENYQNTWQSVVVIKLKEILYNIDFQYFKQQNMKTGHVRRIRLIVS